ncbi:bifunctional UDP-N-acetylglucosamine diphosphorylase/glucosamine-1-phosphate N-acetyltransferase GlmU [Amycolatopsis rhizosphaerae]|uniref:Bifunctional protein GlmU n=1 Tax=Amycolatopsis rhizosphaerae TaxID=2053003 RepID=A0A558BLN4_9PSEU|nr:bifunctional UDP-N-acetylglucosamine diphosphorylase/glucosamine-1-phosphate N-acetyltransferase GlmU [Amycolatopsis rhizosphaerae]TVT37418.1 bifunctional UDP-N-acetylglucosamine diphosphorylase/glucosamine-1-phosphate N-acetyltransferase GlmU [Amycolatopsis rhizosphaerae]
MTGPLSTLVLAAGEGTRMRSATPKVLHPIAGRPLVEHAVRAVAGLEPDNLVVVVGHQREAVVAHLDRLAGDLGRPVGTAVQETQQGTGHAVSCALATLPPGLTGTVLVSYGDVPLLDTATLSALLEEHHGSGHAVTVLTAVPADPTGYGRIVRDGSGAIRGIVEQRDATEAQLEITEINSGVYAFDATLLADGLTRLSTDNSQGEFYLTDVLTNACAEGRDVGALVVDDPWLTEGVNDRAQLSVLGAELNRRLVRRWQLAGVTVVDPATTWLDADVTLARDVRIEPGVQLHGTTSIGEGAVVGPDCTLTDVTIGAGAKVVRTHGVEAEIGEGASVGPFAYLRPGTRLGARGKIGTFVETKKADIGEGSKVPHLTYVGDATIGEYSNIGASSVFVNYDGVRKHHTRIGSHVRTGSDNMFVAPVEVGDGAYTGAGTVIRRNVPPGALAVSTGPQRNIEGWVTRRRAGTPAADAAEAALAAEENQEIERESSDES